MSKLPSSSAAIPSIRPRSAIKGYSCADLSPVTPRDGREHEQGNDDENHRDRRGFLRRVSTSTNAGSGAFRRRPRRFAGAAGRCPDAAAADVEPRALVTGFLRGASGVSGATCAVARLKSSSQNASSSSVGGPVSASCSWPGRGRGGYHPEAARAWVGRRPR